MSFYHHNQSVEFKSIKNKLPKRSDFIDKEINALVNDDIKNRKPLYFLSNDVKEGPPFRDFELSLSGILPCGSKTIITIVNILPYVDVSITKQFSQSYRVLSKVMTEKSINFSTIILMKGKKLIGFTDKEKEFARIKFNTTTMRKKFIEEFGNKYEMFNCDTSCYYRSVAREYHINLASWNIIKKYKLDSTNRFKGQYNFIVDVKDIEGLNDIPDTVIIGNESLANDIIRKDKSFLMSYDIEMYTPYLKSGRIPDGTDPTDDLFMIGLTYTNTNEDQSVLNVVITTKYNNPDPEFLTIVCPSEKEVMIMFAMLISSLQPDFITEFNGSEYDWPAIYNKLEYHNLLKDFRELACMYQCTEYDLKINNISKWIFTKERVKIGANTNLFPFTYRDFGFITFDTRIIFRSLHQKIEKTSLNSFLQANQLPSKDDLPIPTLFKYYEDSDPELMRLVSHYCFVDCLSLHKLNMKRNVIQDKREIARLSYTSLYDSFYRADSMRVTNLIVSTCLENNVFSSTLVKRDKKLKQIDDIDDEEEKRVKFPGAIVLEPKLGTICSTLSIYEFLKKYKHIDDSVIKINDLYYSLINVLYDYIYNIYSCKIINYEIIEDKLNIEILSENDRYKFIVDIRNLEKFVDYTKNDSIKIIIKHINEYSNYVENNKMQYPISALDFASLYPSLIMTYNISPDSLIENEEEMLEYKEKGYEIMDIDFTMMDNTTRIKAWIVRGKKDENNKIDYYFGLYPTVLKKLFDMRKAVKKIFIPIKERKEELEKEENFGDEYQKLMFDYNYYNSKQLGIKVFMNTFYGVLGTEISPLFKLPLAGCVTTNGRRSLLLIKDYIEQNFDTTVYYGDSVIGKTPIIIKLNGSINVIYMEDLYDLFSRNEVFIFNSGKNIIDTSDYDLYVMSDSGWSKIKKLIKHKTNKQIFKVSTNNGIVSVTKDHSLLNEKKESIKPTEINNETKLLCWKFIKSNKGKLDNIESLIKYYYYKNGIFDGNHLTITIDNNNEAILICDYLNKFYKKLKFKIIRVENNYIIMNEKVNLAILKSLTDYLDYFVISLLGKLVIMDSIRVHKKIVYYNKIKHRFMERVNVREFLVEITNKSGGISSSNYDKVNNIEYPLLDKKLFHMDYQIIKLFVEEFDVFNREYISELQLQSIIVLLKLLNYSYNIIELSDGSFKLQKSNIISSSSKVNHISYVQTNRNVYDIETANSHFAAGLGQLVVHNTDSLYFSCSKKEFTEYDKNYYLGKISKLDYSTKLVEKTFNLTKMINEQVNERLYQDNGQRYLNMSYEEVLFPAMWISKKKYFGVPHEKIINFYPKKLFIKGLDITKRGVSKVLIKTCDKVLFDITSIDNLLTMRELVEKYIDYIFTNKWEVSDFIKTSKYDPTKNNISVQWFVQRMRLLNKPLPEPFGRFAYVIAKKYPYTYDIKGRQTPLKVGDKMEYVEEFESNNMEIDLIYYFNGELIGQFAKYILYDDEFHVIGTDGELDETASLNKSKKYIESITKKYTSGYSNKGKIFKDLYRNVSKLIKLEQNKNKFSLVELSDEILNDDKLIEKYINGSIKKKFNIDKIAQSIVNDLENKGLDIYDLKKLYNTKPESYYRNIQKDIYENILNETQRIKKYIKQNESCNKYLNKNEMIINEAVEKIKEQYKFEDILISNIEKLEDVVKIEDIKEFVDTNVDKTVEVEKDDMNKIKEFEELYKNLIQHHVNKQVQTKINDIISIKIKNKINQKIF